jgi:hypothetical protein
MPKYEEALAKASGLSDDALVKEWGEKVGGLFAAKHFDASILKCAHFIPESTSLTAHLVVDANGSSPPTRIADEMPTPFSSCLKGELQTLAWPKAPASLRYLPIEIKGHYSGASADKPADDVIIDVAPANKSLERTRGE